MNHTGTALGSAMGMSERVATGIRDRADPRLVLADRVDQLYGQMWLGILATFVLGAIASFEFSEPRLRELVWTWWFIVLVVTASSAALLYAYRRAANRSANAEQWLRWLAIAALASGATWGGAAAVFFPSHTDEQQ